MLNDTDVKTRGQRILEWQEAVATLPDNRFFDIMRVYLGEIKTPYNKQRLIEQLGAFLHKEQNRKNLAALLDDVDKEIITAVTFLPDVTQTKLSDFFSGEHTLATLYSRLVNLSDRLILYNEKDDSRDQQHIRVNPLLEETLSQYIHIRRILPAAECAFRIDDVPFCLSPEFIAAFAAYVMEKPELCKGDGTIKKNNETRLGEIFPGKTTQLQLLFTAFLNLQLVKQNEKSVTLDRNRFKAFAELPQKNQYAFLCAAAAGRLGREGLRSQAQLLLDCASSIPPGGAARNTLLRIAVLLGTTAAKQSRFSRMIDQSRQPQSESGGTDQLFDRIIDSAEAFGVFTVTGKTAAGEKIYSAGAPVVNEEPHRQPCGKVVSIDAGFTITILPGLPLKALFPLVSTLNVRRCNTVAEFEITRSSAVRAFDAGFTAEEITRVLSEHTPYPIPQNLRISIEDWSNYYSAAMLYKGYVLKVDDKNAQLIEKNPNASKYVHARLAPGVYLLTITTDEEAAEFINGCGLDSIGKVQSAGNEQPPAAFPLLSDAGFHAAFSVPEKESVPEEPDAGSVILRHMHDALDTLDLTDMQKNGLSHRIDHRMILSPEQLCGSTVHAENLEATGMDFLGKVRLIENAISTKDMIEFVMLSEHGSATQETYLGTPLQLIKGTGDADVRLQLEPQKDIREFSVSRAVSVKLIRASLF